MGDHRWPRTGDRAHGRLDKRPGRHRGGAHRSTSDDWEAPEEHDTAEIPLYVDENVPGGHGAAAHHITPAAGYGGAHRARGDDADSVDYGHADTGYVEPGYAEPGYAGRGQAAEPGYAEPGYAGDGYAEQGYGRHGHAEPGYAEQGYVESGYGEHGFAGQEYAGSGYAEGYAQAPHADHGYAEPAHAASGYGGHGFAAEEYGHADYDEADYHRSGYHESGYDEAGYAYEDYAEPVADDGYPADDADDAHHLAAGDEPEFADEDLESEEADDAEYEPEDPRPRRVRTAASTSRSARRRGGRREPARGSRRRAPAADISRGRRSRVSGRQRADRERRRKLLLLGGTLALVVVAVIGYGGYKYLGFGGPPDYSGSPGDPTVIQVHRGDTASSIAQTMQDKGVVKSSGAFYQAAIRNSKGMDSLQPGYYSVPTHSKGTAAVAALMDKGSRVGNVVVSGGKRLHDSNDVHTGARNEGIYRKIADASCLGTGSNKKCVTYEQLDAAGAAANPADLGVPVWAMDAVQKVPDRTRQLEGLIAAGSWDFDPSGTPQQILAQLVKECAAGYESTGLLQSKATNTLNPYQTLIASSLVEREALPQDMTKVARVIVNRLAVNQPLQFDSTVNYTLDRTEVATTDADRARKTPWNTYAMSGLPATPISSPSLDAMRAMENPTPGPWLYFVTVDKQGTTLFTDSYSEHLQNIEKAQQSGILDSGR